MAEEKEFRCVKCGHRGMDVRPYPQSDYFPETPYSGLWLWLCPFCEKLMRHEKLASEQKGGACPEVRLREREEP